MEEYENLKRLPDPRQLTAQRLQQQQQQQQLTSSAMLQLPQLQQMYIDLFRSMSAEDQQSLDYTKMLQYAYELGLAPEKNSSLKPTTDSNDVVLLESDDEQTDNAQ